MKTANALPASLFSSKTTNVLTQGVGQVNAAAAVGLARAFVPNADKLKAGQQVLRSNAALPGSFKIGGETVATKIFGRLSAWQNWIFSRPNAVGEHGALKRYGSGARARFDRERI